MVLAMFTAVLGSTLCGGLRCDCVGPAAPPVALREAVAVVEATVLSVRDSSHVHPEGGFYSIRSVVLRVHRRWKGSPDTTLVLYSRLSDCEYPFAVGGRYLIYANRNTDGLTTSICTRTRLIRAAASDLEALGSPLPIVRGGGA